MYWKKIFETEELISFEKKKKNLGIRIEGSLNKKGQWDIYKVYYDGKGLNHVEEYSAENREQALDLINKMKKKKDQSIDKIKMISGNKVVAKKLDNKEISFCIKRVYMEENIEKWIFSLEKTIKNNFVVVRFGEETKLDLVIHEKYKLLEEEIIKSITLALGLDELEREISWDVYYFRQHKKGDIKNNSWKKNKGGIFLGKIEFGIFNVNDSDLEDMEDVFEDDQDE